MNDSGYAWWTNRRSFIELEEQRLEINWITGDQNWRIGYRQEDGNVNDQASNNETKMYLNAWTKKGQQHQVQWIRPCEGGGRKVRQMWQAGSDT